jgi:exonuclease III
MNRSISVFSWNVRGLHDPIKCGDVLSELLSSVPDIVLLQETKLSDIPLPKRHSFPPHRLDACIFKPANGASGGIFTAWNNSTFSVPTSSSTEHTLTVSLVSTTSNCALNITNVYAPPSHPDKAAFLDELHSLNLPSDVPWMLIGDFNMIRFPHEKNNSNFHSGEAEDFNDFINDSCLIDLPLLDRAFTWSNKRSAPTLERIDRTFINLSWDALFPGSSLSSRTRCTSDHVPLLVQVAARIPKATTFRFDNYWVRCLGF